MATLSGGLVPGGAEGSSPRARQVWRAGAEVGLINVQGQPVKYLMRGIDLDCGTLTYRYWVVSGTPDFAGALYGGDRCGATPLSNVTATRVS